MTKTEQERLAVLETKVDRQGEDLKDIKDDVKTVLLRIENLENIFVTRREAVLIKTVIGIVASVLGIYIGVKGL